MRAMECTRFPLKISLKGDNLTGSKGEQPLLHETHCLALICMPIKYHPNISKSIRVIEHTNSFGGSKGEQLFLHVIHPLDLIHMPTIYFQNFSKGD